ncbi:hypothetical protein RA24_01765 [Leisingera sp. ANG-M6]|nr:hypothetical protein RA24_01765 [Leisingera sp. ANG-M6]
MLPACLADFVAQQMNQMLFTIWISTFQEANYVTGASAEALKTVFDIIDKSLLRYKLLGVKFKSRSITNTLGPSNNYCVGRNVVVAPNAHKNRTFTDFPVELWVKKTFSDRGAYGPLPFGLIARADRKQVL